MNLNKSQALLLSKVLFNHAHVYPDMFNEKMQDLLTQLNEFLVGDEDEDEDGEEEDTQADEDEDEDEDEDDSPEFDATVTAAVLHELAAVDSEGNTLEFEECGTHKSVDVLLSGDVEHENVQYLRRTPKTIDFWEKGEWTSYPVKKFDKSWKKTLEQSVIYHVV